MSTRKSVYSRFGAAAALLVCAAIAGCSSNVAPPASQLAATSAPTTEAPTGETPKIEASKTTKASSILWKSSFEEAQAEAQKTGKPLMIDFYTDWCSACKMMDAQAYPQPEIVAESRNFVMVKVNAEKRRDLAQSYRVSSYPTLLWLNDKGEVLHSQEGYGGVDLLQSDMKTALSAYKSRA